MGCICSKGVRTNDDFIETNHVSIAKDLLKASKKQPSSSINNENLGSEEISVNGNEATLRLIPSDTNNQLSDEEEEEEKKESFEIKSSESVLQKETTVELLDNIGPLQPRMSRIGSVRNGERTAKVIAGWPSWLVSVAGGALNGWIPRSADSFEKLEMVRRAFESQMMPKF